MSAKKKTKLMSVLLALLLSLPTMSSALETIDAPNSYTFLIPTTIYSI